MTRDMMNLSSKCVPLLVRDTTRSIPVVFGLALAVEAA